jgi:hypothetical protein
VPLPSTKCDASEPHMWFSNELDVPCDEDMQIGLTRHALWGHYQRQWGSQCLMRSPPQRVEDATSSWPHGTEDTIAHRHEQKMVLDSSHTCGSCQCRKREHASQQKSWGQP